MRFLHKAIRNTRLYFPFSVHFLLFSAFFIPALWYMRYLSQQPESSYSSIFSLLLVVSLAAACVLITTGFISAFIAFIIFRVNVSSAKVGISITTITSSPVRQHVILDPCLKPLFGFISLRFVTDSSHYTKRFVIVKPSLLNIFSTRIETDVYWTPEHIREYTIDRTIIYLEDWFRFFSFAVPVPAAAHISKLPLSSPLKDLKADPRRTEEITRRIDQLRKVEGEMINYKNFESNDDVRRIVWKIYAKNKDLVVRIPEILDPYASHLYFCVSFHAPDLANDHTIAQTVLLDHYKSNVWSCYEMLAAKGFDVRYISERNRVPSAMTATAVQAEITRAGWQSYTALSELVPSRDTSVLMVSSLNNVQDVSTILERQNLTVIFVKLSEAVKSSPYTDWIKFLFIAEDKTERSLRAQWKLSAFRRRMIENESRITKLLATYEKGGVTTLA
jgi:hypothetical protein